VVGRSCRTRGPSGGLTAAAARGAAHSLSGRADALYVVNDALGSLLLRANEVIDQVPMSACGTFATWRDVRLESVMRTKADSDYSGLRATVERPTEAHRCVVRIERPRYQPKLAAAVTQGSGGRAVGHQRGEGQVEGLRLLVPRCGASAGNSYCRPGNLPHVDSLS
jgi:hypothetical protein